MHSKACLEVTPNTEYRPDLMNVSIQNQMLSASWRWWRLSSGWRWFPSRP